MCRFLDHSTFGVGVDVLLAFTSVVYVAVYITNTYLPLNTVLRHFHLELLSGWATEVSNVNQPPLLCYM